MVFIHSPSGKLVQIEYALAAVAAGAPSVGIKGMVKWNRIFTSWFWVQNPITFDKEVYFEMLKFK